MLGIAMMILGGFAIGYAIYDSVKDDDGSDSDLNLTGTEGDDLLEGNIGNDEITGLGGNDDLLGHAGNDRISGNDGDDIGIGGDGDDVLRGATGDDQLQGNDGDDQLYGDNGDDLLFGGTGDDAVNGGQGDDILVGNIGADTLEAGNGEDALFGGNLLERELTQDEMAGIRDAGDTATFPVAYDVTDDHVSDRLDGGDGNDSIYAGEGDIVETGDGEDTVYLLGGETADPAQVMDFSGAQDALVYVYEPTGDDDPEVEVSDNGDSTYDVAIDGQTIAVVRSDTAITADDVTLYALGGSDAAAAA